MTNLEKLDKKLTEFFIISEYFRQNPIDPHNYTTGLYKDAKEKARLEMLNNPRFHAHVEIYVSNVLSMVLQCEEHEKI